MKLERAADPDRRGRYKGPVTLDWYGRSVPKPAHGSVNLGRHTSSSRIIIEAVQSLFDRIVDPRLLIRRLNIATMHVLPEGHDSHASSAVQLELFVDYEAQAEQKRKEENDAATTNENAKKVVNSKN